MEEKQETVADIVAEMRGIVKPGETLEHTYELLNGLADRIEAVARRALNEIDGSVCATEDISSVDIDYIRLHMKNTIGDYYE